MEGGESARILDHIALAAARHHSIEVQGNVEQGIELIPKAYSVLQELASLEEMQIALPYAIEAMQQGSLADEPPGPSEDFYLLYCLTQRLIKVADWEDAGEESIELIGLPR